MWTLLLEKKCHPKKRSSSKLQILHIRPFYVNYCCSVVSQVPCWLPGFHLEFHVSKVYVDWLLGQSFGRWRSSKQGPTTIGMVRLVIFDRDYVSRIVNPLVYDVDLSISFYISRFCQLEWRNRSHYCFIEQYCIHSKAPSIQKHSKNNRIVESS